MAREDKLLIVEDNPLIAAAIEKAAERLNMDSHLAADGWEAIEMLRTQVYTAIVIDTDLPRHSGYGVITYLQEEDGDDTLDRVVVMTSGDPVDVRRRTSEHLRVIDRTDTVDDIAAALTRS
jgi:DNA-binding response OmpR family regulator